MGYTLKRIGLFFRNFAFTLSMAARFPLVRCSQIIAMPYVIIGVIFNSNNFIAVFSESFGRFFILVIAMVAAVTLSFTCFVNVSVGLHGDSQILSS